MTTHAGKMDRRISILRASKAKDGYNAEVLTWHPFASVWAEAIPVLDAERLRAGETLGSKKYRFIVRYNPDTATVDHRDRVVFDGREYDVNGAKEVGRRELVEITATARAQTP